MMMKSVSLHLLPRGTWPLLLSVALCGGVAVPVAQAAPRALVASASSAQPVRAKLALSVKGKPSSAPRRVKKTRVQKKATRPTIYQVPQRIALKRKDFHCLARNIYHEAQGEPVVGKLAVAQITLNRLQAGLWGSSVCKVVYAPAQFSWTDQPRKRHAKPQGPEWEESVQVAKDFLGGQRVRRLEASTHFHSQSIRAPGWTRQMRVAQQVGQHIFFNDKSVELKNS